MGQQDERHGKNLDVRWEDEKERKGKRWVHFNDGVGVLYERLLIGLLLLRPAKFFKVFCKSQSLRHELTSVIFSFLLPLVWPRREQKWKKEEEKEEKNMLNLNWKRAW